jgi:hypothetical protein
MLLKDAVRPYWAELDSWGNLIEIKYRIESRDPHDIIIKMNIRKLSAGGGLTCKKGNVAVLN